MTTVRVSLKNIDQMINTMDPDILKKAVFSAGKHTSGKMQTQISKKTRERYNIPAGALSKTSKKVSIRLKQTPEGILLTYAGKRLSPFDYKATVSKAKFNKANYLYNSVSMKILKSKRKKKIKGEYGHGAFNPISRKGPSKFKGVVFERMLKKTLHADHADGSIQKGRWTSLPVRKVTTPAVPQLVGNEEVKGMVEKEFEGMLDQRFTHEMSYYLRKAAGA